MSKSDLSTALVDAGGGRRIRKAKSEPPGEDAGRAEESGRFGREGRDQTHHRALPGRRARPAQDSSG